MTPPHPTPHHKGIAVFSSSSLYSKCWCYKGIFCNNLHLELCHCKVDWIPFFFKDWSSALSFGPSLSWYLFGGVLWSALQHYLCKLISFFSLTPAFIYRLSAEANQFLLTAISIQTYFYHHHPHKTCIWNFEIDIKIWNNKPKNRPFIILCFTC